LIDVRLPDMEGIELLSKQHGTKPKMRKIIVTGYPTLQNAVSAVNNGADAYVMKPFEVEKICRPSESSLRSKRKRRASAKRKSSSSLKHASKPLETTGQTAVAKKK
jgi:DNA-binding NtrC family response regulator